MDAATRRAVSAGVGVLLLAAFVVLGMFTGERPTEPDQDVKATFHGAWQRTAGQVAALISVPLGPTLPVVVGLILLGMLLLAYRAGDRGRAVLLLKLLVVGGLCRLVSALKPAFDRERPRVYPDLSYPSGHVTSVACTAFVLVLLTWWLGRSLLPLVAVVSVLAVLITAAARLVLGVHWLTDTVGAVLGVTGIGLLAAAVLGLIPVRSRERVTR